MPTYSREEFELKRARDKAELAKFQRLIAEQESIIANTSGFRAKKKIIQAENKIERLRLGANTIITQIQYEDAQIEVARLAEERRVQREIEEEKQRELNRIEEEERQRRQKEEELRKENETRLRAEQKQREKEKKERIEVERWASLTPEEQEGELTKKRRMKIFAVGGFIGVVFVCFMIVLISRLNSISEMKIPDDIGKITVSLPRTFKTAAELNFTIQKIEVISELERNNPTYYYLIIEGILTNQNDETACSQPHEYQLITDRKEFEVDTKAARDIHRIHMGKMDDQIALGEQCLDSGEAGGALLVYDLSPQNRRLKLSSALEEVQLGDMAAFIV